MCSCNRQNPFLTEWDTPYGIPPYDKIKTSDYIPAIKAGIDEQTAQIEAIVSNPEAPTFDNTIAPLELSGGILAKVQGVLYNVSETDRSDALDAVQDEAIPLLSAHGDNISFNKALYHRVAEVYNADQSGLTREQQMVLKKWYDGFIRDGIGLPEDKQEELRVINTRTAELTQKIGNNILAESNAFAQKFGFSVSAYPDKMTTTEDRELRRQYNEAYRMRGHNGNENDNRELIKELLSLRIRKANILGYETSAEYTLADKMAANPETVDAFLMGIMTPAVQKAKEELADMQAVMDEDIKAGKLPEGSKIEQWDWWYYAEKVRKAKYDLDEAETRPYFKAENVVKGVFAAAKILYGVNAEVLEGVPSYNPDCVTTYKLTNDDGSLIGIFTTDYFPRESKRGGAWMNNVREQYYDANGVEVRPIIVNVGNLSEYMSIDEVQTAFHEFGHALHGLLSKCHYPSVSGTSVKRDFVEMFSQFNENWAFQPELLEKYAINDKGEVIPAALVEKINNALKFNQGFMTGYYGYLWAEVLDKDAFSIFEASPEGVWNIDLAHKFKQTFLEKGGSEEPMVLYKSFAGREPNSDAMLRGRGLID